MVRIRTVFLSDVRQPLGMAYHDGFLFIGCTDAVLRFPYKVLKFLYPNLIKPKSRYNPNRKLNSNSNLNPNSNSDPKRGGWRDLD